MVVEFLPDAMDELSQFAIKHNIPVTQTVMGYSINETLDHSQLGPDWWFCENTNTFKETDLAIAVFKTCRFYNWIIC